MKASPAKLIFTSRASFSRVRQWLGLGLYPRQRILVAPDRGRKAAGSQEALRSLTAHCFPPSTFCLSASAAARGRLLRVLGLAECAAGLVGFVVLAVALVEGNEAFEDGGGAGLYAERGLVVADGVAVALLVFEYGGELEVRVVLVRGGGEVSEGRVVFLQARLDDGEVVVDDGRAVRKLRGLLQMPERALVVVGEVERVAEVGEDVRVFGRGGERAVVGFGGQGVPAHAVVGEAEEVVGLGQVGADLRGGDGQFGD